MDSAVPNAFRALRVTYSIGNALPTNTNRQPSMGLWPPPSPRNVLQDQQVLFSHDPRADDHECSEFQWIPAIVSVDELSPLTCKFIALLQRNRDL